MKNIAFIIPSLAPVGPNIFTKNLVEFLSIWHKDVAIEVFYCKPIFGLTFPVRTQPLSDFPRSDINGFDIVFSTMLQADIWLAFGRHGIPAGRRVSIIHNMLDEDVFFFYRRNPFKKCTALLIWKAALKRIGRLIVSSPFMETRYSSLLGGSPIIDIIPYGISDPRQRAAPFKWRPQAVDEQLLLISCGSLIQRKNFAAVIRALPFLPNACFLIIGDGPERKNLEALAAELDVNERVKILGYRSDLAQQLAQAHCYVMPSFSEGYGLALLEALGLGMPIACADLPIYDDMLPTESVPRFSPDDPTSVAAAISIAAANQTEYANLNRDLYLTLHRAEIMADKIYAYIRKF